jgi:hypothetical protein
LALPSKNLILGLYSIEKPSMVQKFASLLILLVTGFTTFAQTTPATPAKKGRPDIPGTFVVEIGLNRGLDAPSSFDIGLWGSRTVNIYYQYEIRLFNSRMSFVPGIGLSLERYRFKSATLVTVTDDSVNLTFADPATISLKKTQLITNFVDLPLELRYSSKPEDPTRSFKMAVGGRIGYLYDSFNKLKYKQDGELIQVKNKRDFNLNNLRYGVSARIGFGNFAVVGYYNLTNLFEDGKGIPSKGVVQDFPTYTIGISLSSF